MTRLVQGWFVICKKNYYEMTGYKKSTIIQKYCKKQEAGRKKTRSDRGSCIATCQQIRRRNPQRRYLARAVGR
jgi:hypothetical protein